MINSESINTLRTPANKGKLIKREIINFALNLLQESENIPEEFAKVIIEDLWEII